MRWMLFFLMVGTVAADDRALLERFRNEFVKITPGTVKFPESYEFGCRDRVTRLQKVRLNQAFAVAKYEVPQNLWQAVMGSNPSRWKGPRNSVEMVSYLDAKEFCARITQKLRQASLIGQDQIVRLPTEVEWEYVARAGTSTKFSFGDDVGKLDDYAWSTHNAAGNDPPVGAKKPNPWGLYDVHGYLWEWCELEPDDKDGQKGKRAVLRGGSWKDKADQLKSCSRRLVDSKLTDDAVGFRCILAQSKKAIPK